MSGKTNGNICSRIQSTQEYKTTAIPGDSDTSRENIVVVPDTSTTREVDIAVVSGTSWHDNNIVVAPGTSWMDTQDRYRSRHDHKHVDEHRRRSGYERWDQTNFPFHSAMMAGKPGNDELSDAAIHDTVLSDADVSADFGEGVPERPSTPKVASLSAYASHDSVFLFRQCKA